MYSAYSFGKSFFACVTGVADTASGAGGAAKAVETAKEKLEKYIDALKGMSSAQKSARDADKSC